MILWASLAAFADLFLQSARLQTAKGDALISMVSLAGAQLLLNFPSITPL
jgi:hypothetical protein